jgi:hypothetical protein
MSREEIGKRILKDPRLFNVSRSEFEAIIDVIEAILQPTPEGQVAVEEVKKSATT